MKYPTLMSPLSAALVSVAMLFIPTLSGASPEFADSATGKAAISVWKRDGHRFTPALKQSFLVAAKARALSELSSAGKILPSEFLAWVDSDPIVQATVYGARQNAAHVLLMLRSLEIDLGKEVVRKSHTQLALAMAVVHAAKGMEANLSPRKLLQIVIPGDPRRPVNTTDKNRTLDLNDHIINFLNSHTIQEEVIVGEKLEPPPLRYDAKGIAIPQPKNAQKVKVPIKEMRTRTLYAADVMASRAWQEKFNAYMKLHGQSVSIDCGDQVIHWKSTAAVSAERKKIAEAFLMFRNAYQEKGLLPKERDPFPSPAESMAYLIRNNRYVFPAEAQEQRKWPRYPLNAPWPTLTLLAADDQPLREREERWIAFRDEGIMRTYGEYIGGIAQQFDMQSARRLSPFSYTYGSYQMMAKDGGVCGTMANMGVRTNNTLGIPSCTAGQPGHCALIQFAYDPKLLTYECRGGQFATGGPEQTSPHTPWVFGDVDARRPMIYYQTIAWAVNYSLQGFLDSCLAYQFFRQLPASEKTAHGTTLLMSALERNPYNLLITDAAQTNAPTAMEQLQIWKSFQQVISEITKPGCPQDKLHIKTVREKFFAQLAALPVPTDPAVTNTMMSTLAAESCTNAQTLTKYQCALHGVESVIRQTETDFRKHLQSVRTDASCRFMAATLDAVLTKITDKKLRQQWLENRWQELQGRDAYLDKSRIFSDACLALIAKHLRQKPADEATRYQPVLDQLSADFQKHVEGPRTVASCRQFTGIINSVARQIKDPVQLRTWLTNLATTIQGRETFTLPNNKPSPDPCATAIAKILETVATE